MGGGLAAYGDLSGVEERLHIVAGAGDFPAGGAMALGHAQGFAIDFICNVAAKATSGEFHLCIPFWFSLGEFGTDMDNQETKMAGTDSSKKLDLRAAPVVVLCEPQLGENIGTAIRAMANFGLWELRLVNPREGWPNEKAAAASTKATHVLERVQVFERVEEAIADLSLVYATTARKRDMFKPVIGPDEAGNKMFAHISAGQKAGLLFGRERWGLNNDEVVLCDAIVTLPVEEAFASLNIAQAVLVLAYEWRRASRAGEGLPFDLEAGVPASKEDVVRMFEHLESSLAAGGFFTVPEKRASMVHNLRTMLTRANFNAQEVRTFRGVISALERKHRRKS